MVSRRRGISSLGTFSGMYNEVLRLTKAFQRSRGLHRPGYPRTLFGYLRIYDTCRYCEGYCERGRGGTRASDKTLQCAYHITL